MDDRRITKTKNAIKDTALDLFLEMDYSDITVTEITKNANIARKTFYLHYQSIDDVIKDICNDMYDTLIKNAHELIKNNYSIEKLLYDLNVIIKDNIKIFKRIAINDSYKIFKDTFQTIIKDITIYIVENIYKIKTSNVSLYASFYSAAIIDLYFIWLKDETNLTLDEIASLCNKAVFNGVNKLIEDKVCYL